MVFSSILFLFLFLPLSLGIYYVTPRRWRNFALLLLNLVFYGWGEPVYICIMIFSILVDYANGWIIENNRHRPKVAKGALLCSLVANLGMLLFFKYSGFFIVTNMTALLRGTAISSIPWASRLPLGISFYTFQTMSYTIDVYRGKVQAQRQPHQFWRFRHPLPPADRRPHRQIHRHVDDQLTNRRENVDQICRRASRLFVCGLGKKVLLANNIGALVDEVCRGHGSPASSRAGRMAGRAGLCLPDLFRLLRLFRYGHRPGADARASISQDQLQLPLYLPQASRSSGGAGTSPSAPGSGSTSTSLWAATAGANLKTYRNILIVWLLTGIWHGAAWNFLCWGLFFALFLMLEKAVFAANGWSGLPPCSPTPMPSSSGAHQLGFVCPG